MTNAAYVGLVSVLVVYVVLNFFARYEDFKMGLWEFYDDMKSVVRKLFRKGVSK